MKTFRDIGELRGKIVLLQINMDVGVESGKILDSEKWRIDTSLPLLKELSQKGAKIVVFGHRGRPSGKRDKNLSLEPILDYLRANFDQKSGFSGQSIGPEVQKDIAGLGDGELLVLENLRFYPGEETNNEEFAKNLASLGDVYINNDFATMHREHASIVNLPNFLPSYAGPLIEKEVKELGEIKNFVGPELVLIMGGTKAETKLKVIGNFIRRGNKILLAGVLANTFLKEKDFEVGISVVGDSSDIERDIIKNRNIILPIDVVTSKSLRSTDSVIIKAVSEVSRDEAIVDIGPKTTELFIKEIEGAKISLWNGTLGIVEVEEFSNGSKEFAKEFVKGNRTVVGGGDIVSFLNRENILDDIDYISTGGGAMLEFLAGEELLGLNVLGYQDGQ